MKIFKVLLSDSDYDDFISAVMVAKDEDTIREHEDEFHQGFLPWDETKKAKMPIVGVAFRMNSYQGFKSIEEIGTYDPLKDPSEIIIDNEAAKRWLANGAQPTDTVRALLKKSGIVD